jgi:hypothetical protein
VCSSTLRIDSSTKARRRTGAPRGGEAADADEEVLELVTPTRSLFRPRRTTGVKTRGVERKECVAKLAKLVVVNGHGGSFVLSNVVQDANVAGPRMVPSVSSRLRVSSGGSRDADKRARRHARRRARLPHGS